MPKRSVGMIVNDAEWVAGSAALRVVTVSKTKSVARNGAREMLAEARQRAHKVTGRMAESGRIEERETESTLEIDVIFGGEEWGVDYAGYEESLHPYLAPAAAQLSRVFEEVDDDLSMAWQAHAISMDY